MGDRAANKQKLASILADAFNKVIQYDGTRPLNDTELQVKREIYRIEEEVFSNLLGAKTYASNTSINFDRYTMDPRKLKTDEWNFSEVLRLSEEAESALSAFFKGIDALGVQIAGKIKESGEYDLVHEELQEKDRIRKRRLELKKELNKKMKAEIDATLRAEGLYRDDANPEGSDSDFSSE